MRALPRKHRLCAALLLWLPLAAHFVILSMVLVCVLCFANIVTVQYFSPQPPALVSRFIIFVLSRVPAQWCGEGHKQNGYLVAAVKEEQILAVN